VGEPLFQQIIGHRKIVPGLVEATDLRRCLQRSSSSLRSHPMRSRPTSGWTESDLEQKIKKGTPVGDKLELDDKVAIKSKGDTMWAVDINK
jgi:hypothetical protein